MIDIALDPGVGLDENRHNGDTDTDVNFDGGASFKQSHGRNLLEYRHVDGGADISQGRSHRIVLTTGDSRVVVACLRNQLVHPGQDREDR